MALTCLLGGCGSGMDSQPASGHSSADAPQARIVVGTTATANEPTIGFGPDETAPIWEVVKKGTVGLTAFVGSRSDQPVLTKDMSVYYDRATGEIQTDERSLQDGFANHMTFVKEKLGSVTNEQSDLDLFGLLSVMSKVPGKATLLVYSSGLQTTGLLDLRGQGSDLDVEATMARLPQDQLPKLVDKRVIFIGLGQVAGPQQRLTPRMSEQVQQLWLAVCRKAGGDCDDTVLPSTGGPPKSTVAVPTVPVPELLPVTVRGDLNSGRTTTLRLPNGALFKKESAEYLPDAEQLVRDTASYFLADEESVPTRATAVGHTATHGERAGALRLSEQRAQVVVATLVAAGVPAELFEVVDGVGFDEPLVPDLDVNGQLIADAAEQNRTVVLTVTRVWSTS